ncbi:hypothetical protein HNV08_07080 [Winogradskyella eckloniae]|uniref:hypothetical protein n=1 Tax=Winogradskyella eckloniae TaxID=1089306 RepID=UPI0015635740|nr:hypothetical protein [Winogradskyella eckloniae]NRD19808.1 hypothetical protein [Winogradskyella eckloniae]
MKHMKSATLFNTSVFIIVLLIPFLGWSQVNRLKPPKRNSKIESVDKFVNHSFELYHKVFVYDSLYKAGVEVPAEIEDALIERAERDVDSLWQEVPNIVDDISDAPFMKQAKATFNLNRSKKALKFCMTAVKEYFVGIKEDED